MIPQLVPVTGGSASPKIPGCVWRQGEGILTSGKSTQNAFMLRPYRKPANDSPKRARDSCISWKCIKLASRSAIESASSANACSKVLSGNGASCSVLALAESRKEERDEGRSGVVGRGVRGLEADRLTLWSRLLPKVAISRCLEGMSSEVGIGECTMLDRAR